MPEKIKKIFLSKSIPRYKKLKRQSNAIRPYPAPDVTVKKMTENAGCINNYLFYNSTTLLTQSLTFLTRSGSTISCCSISTFLRGDKYLFTGL